MEKIPLILFSDPQPHTSTEPKATTVNLTHVSAIDWVYNEAGKLEATLSVRSGDFVREVIVNDPEDLTLLRRALRIYGHTAVPVAPQALEGEGVPQ